MITRMEQQNARKRAAEMIRTAGIHVTDQEAASIDVVDFGLSQLQKEGVQVLTLVQTERISVKVLALFPNQTEPEHWHPPVAGDPGKEETVRVISGTLYFYIPGENTFKEGFLVKACWGTRWRPPPRPERFWESAGFEHGYGLNYQSVGDWRRPLEAGYGALHRPM